MTVLRVVRRCGAAEMEHEMAARRAPRGDIVAERVAGDDRFEAEHGPFRHYERRLELRRLDAGSRPAGEAESLLVGETERQRVQMRDAGAADPDRGTEAREPPQEHALRDDDEWEMVETTEYRLAIPVWAWLFHFPVRRALLRRQDTHSYWWAPPDRLGARAATVLGLLCTVQVVDGYLGTVLTQTLTFAADEFGHDNEAQGIVLAVVRVGVLIALATVALADRHGRRRLLMASGLGSCVITALGALSPGLWFLGGTQLVARGLSTALGVLIVIVAAEEMPAGSRAWAMSVLALCAGLGAGMAVWVLPVADLHEAAWRAVYLVPLAGTALVGWAGRQLPESRRFEAVAADRRRAETAETASEPVAAARRQRRLALLACSAFLIAVFAAPASGLQNDFLKDERGFSASAITLFTLATSTPAGLGILAGGYLADRRGRRPVGAAGLALGAVAAAVAFFTSGAALWLLTLAGVMVGAMVVPALGVYGPELFGTTSRGRANGMITTVGVAGSALGLYVAGRLSDGPDGRLGPALALLALGPLAVAVLVLWKFPETAGQSLEELNPEDPTL